MGPGTDAHSLRVTRWHKPGSFLSRSKAPYSRDPIATGRKLLSAACKSAWTEYFGH